MEGTRGGLTEIFSVPYPVWVINSTVIAKTRPQYGVFRMVLCYADSGSIIDGEEILNQGRAYRIIQTSNTPVYMIISTENVDSFYLRLETTEDLLRHLSKGLMAPYDIQKQPGKWRRPACLKEFRRAAVQDPFYHSFYI